MNALEKELARIIKKNNRLKLKNLIKSAILLKTPKRNVAFWPNAMAVNALYVLNPNNKIIKRQIDLWQKSNFEISQYDDILMAYYLITKTDILSDKQSRTIIDNVKSSIQEYAQNVIPYRKSNEDLVFIDLLGMAPHFLIHQGVKEEDEKLIEWGMIQFDSFVENAMDQKTKLPFHAYNIQTKEKVGIVGWGRALGWIMTGLAYSIIELDCTHSKQKAHLLDLYESLLAATIKYQRKDGGFSWRLPDINGALDTSATGMILQSMLELKNESKLVGKNIKAAKQMLDCLDSNYQNGKVLNCSAECGGIGIYPQKYGSFAWSVAPYVICKKLSETIPEMK